MSDERRVPITLRMPRILLDALKDAADSRSHSMNAEIVQRLEASLTGGVAPAVPDSADLDAVERALIRMWRAMNDGERSALFVVAERFAEKDQSEHGSRGMQPDEKPENEQVIIAEGKLDAIRRLIEEVDSDIHIIENELKNRPPGLSENSFIIRQINSDLSQMRARRESYWSQMLKLLDVTGARERPHGLLSSEESAFWRRVFDAP